MRLSATMLQIPGSFTKYVEHHAPGCQATCGLDIGFALSTMHSWGPLKPLEMLPPFTGTRMQHLPFASYLKVLIVCL